MLHSATWRISSTCIEIITRLNSPGIMFIDTCGVGCVNHISNGVRCRIRFGKQVTEMDEERRLFMRITGKSFSIAIWIYWYILNMRVPFTELFFATSTSIFLPNFQGKKDPSRSSKKKHGKGTLLYLKK